MTYVINRLKEPSTFAGFAAAVTAASVLPSPWSWIVAGLGCLAVLLGEKSAAG